MNESNPVPEVEEPELVVIPNRSPWSVCRVGLGVICGFALIVSIMPTCSCADRSTRVKVEQRIAAIEKAIRQQTVQTPAPGHERTATANE